MRPNILIVEDDPIIALSLKLLLQKKYSVLNIENNADSAWESCKNNIPDLVLLDVQLVGEKLGTWVGANIKRENLPIKIIYLTVLNDQHTIGEIIETNPIQYITKPFHQNVLLSNIELILSTEKENYFIEIIDGRKKYNINISKITYLKSDGNYVDIVLNNNTKIITRERLNSLVQNINNSNFIRTHQRFVVNCDYISAVDKKFISVGEIQIPISKSYKKMVMEKFNL